jgi:hypothetical protein
MNPGRFVDLMRVEAAQQSIDSFSRGLKEIADACGFTSADAMRRTFLRVVGIQRPNMPFTAKAHGVRDIIPRSLGDLILTPISHSTNTATLST